MATSAAVSAYSAGLSGDPRAGRRRIVAVGALAGSALVLSVVMFAIAPELYSGDLRVYVEGARLLTEPGLYTSSFPIGDGTVQVPFIYPPFSAILFFPLHFLPFPVLAVGWSIATALALWGAVWISVKIVAGHRLTSQTVLSTSMVWTSIALWTAPVRHTLYEGQVSVFLMAGVLFAVYSRSDAVSGTVVGVLAGVKLTPAVTGIFFAVKGRVGAALAAGAAFLVTVVLALCIAPTNTIDYFFRGGLGEVTDRVGGVGTVANQSLRGVLSRFLGFDVGQGVLWVLAASALGILAILAARRQWSDAFAVLIVIQLTTCAVTPLAWSHHWVWIIPTLIWLIHGPLRRSRWAKVISGLWLLGTVTWYLELLLLVQTSNYQYERPLWQSVAGAAYVIGIVAVFSVMVFTRSTEEDEVLVSSDPG